jgi:hypothetical protein
MQLKLAPATLDGPIRESKLTEDWRSFPKATHGALVSGQESGFTLTLGSHARATAVIMCPARGEPVSVWPFGKAPRTQVRNTLPWALFSGPDCRVIAGDLDADGPPEPPQWPDPPTVGWSGWPAGVPQSVVNLTDEISDACCIDKGPVALTILAVLSAALCSKFAVHMLAADGGVTWIEAHVGIFLAGVAPSGARKTPMMETCLAPLRKEAQAAAAGQAMSEAAWRARVDAAQKEIADIKGEDEIDLEDLKEAHYRASEPQPREAGCIVSNATAAALGIELSWLPSVMLATSEGSEIFQALLTKDGRMELAPLLKAYSGEPGGKVARVLRNQPSGNAYRMAALVWTQPSVMYGIGRNTEAVDQGLLGRFLYCAQNARPPTGKVVSAQTSKLWSDLIERARALAGPERDAWGVETGAASVICATPPQTAQLLQLALEMSELTEPGGPYYGLATWARKLHGQVARVAALVTWLMDPSATRINEEALTWALEQARGPWLTWAAHIWQLLSWPPNTDDARHMWAMATKARRDTWAVQELDTLLSWAPSRVDAALLALAERGFVTIGGNRSRPGRTVSFARLG